MRNGRGNGTKVCGIVTLFMTMVALTLVFVAKVRFVSHLPSASLVAMGVGHGDVTYIAPMGAIPTLTMGPERSAFASSVAIPSATNGDGLAVEPKYPPQAGKPFYARTTHKVEVPRLHVPLLAQVASLATICVIGLWTRLTKYTRTGYSAERGADGCHWVMAAVHEIPEPTWRASADAHVVRVRALLEPGFDHSPQPQQRAQRERPDNGLRMLDRHHPVYNFLEAYYHIKGLKGIRSLARWSPPLHRETSGTLLLGATYADLEDGRLPRRGAVVNERGVLYDARSFFEDRDDKATPFLFLDVPTTPTTRIHPYHP